MAQMYRNETASQLAQIYRTEAAPQMTSITIRAGFEKKLIACCIA